MRQAIRTILFGEPRFTPASLYRAGQVGAVYDPAQWATTMFQDSAGTTPVTALEQPVGLALDVKNGVPVLGPELVTNGDFSNGTTGWTAVNATATVANGVITVTAGNGGYGGYTQAITTTQGKTYNVSLYQATTDALTLQVGTTLNGFQIVNRVTEAISERAEYFVAQGTTTYVKVQTVGLTGAKLAAGNISVREVPGNHALMATAANRPLLKQDAAGRYFLRFDSTDYLTASFSPTAGSSATVMFETPAGLATLPAQNVGTSYGLPMRSVDVYGIQIVDTTPTPKQQGQLERYWQAGTVPSYALADDGIEILLADDGVTQILEG